VGRDPIPALQGFLLLNLSPVQQVLCLVKRRSFPLPFLSDGPNSYTRLFFFFSFLPRPFPLKNPVFASRRIPSVESFSFFPRPQRRVLDFCVPPRVFSFSLSAEAVVSLHRNQDANPDLIWTRSDGISCWDRHTLTTRGRQ